MKRAYLVLPLLGALIFPSVVSAQSIAILGIRSVEGDDEFARNLTGALTHAASQVEGWEISDREVSLSQMALVHDCSDPNPSCLHNIAAALGVERVIYGDVARTSSGDDYLFSVNLHHFDDETGQIAQSVADTVSSVRQDIDDLREPARRWVASLAGVPRAGTLVVRVNVPGAEVLVDGASVGVVDGEGVLRVEGVEAGTRQVRVTAEEHATFTSSISIEAYAEATLEGELQSAGGGSFPVDIAIGSGFLVAGAVFAAVWIYSGATVFFMNSSDTWQAIRGLSLTTTDNICASGGIEAQEVMCNQAATLEVLQFVFAGLTAAAGGLGLYFLISGLSDDEDATAETVTLEVLPSFGPNHGFLGARVRF